MKQLSQALALASANLGKGVEGVNPTAAEELALKNASCRFFGVKNTAGIPLALFDKLRSHPDFLWLTVDKMAPLGRSVDVQLTNPITYRHMTGSSSGGCVNILSGINDLAIGTDGGGSVLAPALSTSLYSFLGKGCGLTAETAGKSTDGLDFVGGIGLMAGEFSALRHGAEVLCDADFADGGAPLRVLVPAVGSMPLPDGGDSAERLADILPHLPSRFEFIPHCFAAPYDRGKTVAELRELFRQSRADLILTFEGPIDVYGYDETIPRAFSGEAVSHITGAPGKGLVKAANICGCSAITLPSAYLASGYVILAPPGFPAASAAFALAEAMLPFLRRPDMFERFFTRCEKYAAPFPAF